MKYAAILVVLSVAGASAQPAPPVANTAAPETVTVTGTRILPAKTVDRFVKTYAVPALFLGKLGRWDDRICPKVSGLTPKVNAFIEQRVKEVAQMARVQVDSRVPCRSNVEIVFTPTPQAFMDDIRTHMPDMLGDHNQSPSQAEAMATMTRPIQAYYETEIEDYLGNKHPDAPYIDCVQEHPANPAAFCNIAYMSSIFGDGEKSNFINVLIVADTNKVGGITIRPLADYVAMLALAQTQLSDDCQALPTVANLLAAGCDAANKAAGLTDVDLAYLKALYDMEPGEKLGSQRGDIASRMKQALQSR